MARPSSRPCLPFQIDPSILQQTLQQGSLLSQQLPGEAGLASQNGSLQTQDGTVPASVVIQPISGLSLQPTVTSASLTIGPLAEQDPVMTTSSSGKGQGPAPRLRSGLCPRGSVVPLSSPHRAQQMRRVSPCRRADAGSVPTQALPPDEPCVLVCARACRLPVTEGALSFWVRDFTRGRCFLLNLLLK